MCICGHRSRNTLREAGQELGVLVGYTGYVASERLGRDACGRRFDLRLRSIVVIFQLGRLGLNSRRGSMSGARRVRIKLTTLGLCDLHATSCAIAAKRSSRRGSLLCPCGLRRQHTFLFRARGSNQRIRKGRRWGECTRRRSRVDIRRARSIALCAPAAPSLCLLGPEDVCGASGNTSMTCALLQCPIVR